jgi:hypothetical protein
VNNSLSWKSFSSAGEVPRNYQEQKAQKIGANSFLGERHTPDNIFRL